MSLSKKRLYIVYDVSECLVCCFLQKGNAASQADQLPPQSYSPRTVYSPPFIAPFLRFFIALCMATLTAHCCQQHLLGSSIISNYG